MNKGKGVAVEEIEKEMVDITNLLDWLTPLSTATIEFYPMHLRKHTTTMGEVQSSML